MVFRRMSITKFFNDFTEEVPGRSWKRAVSYTHLGYEHNIQPVSTVTISGDRKLQSVGTDVKILFNQNPTRCV